MNPAGRHRLPAQQRMRCRRFASPNRHSLVGQLTKPGFLIVLPTPGLYSQRIKLAEALNKCVQDCQGLATATPVG
jgi:hypothetical protein